ncbi:MAG: DNA-methyltransferase [Anaerolineae bacterium]
MSLEVNLEKDGIVILPPADVMETLRKIREPVTTTILDPWYNKGAGGERSDYIKWLASVLAATAEISEHIFLWGFPEIVYKVLDHLPRGFELIAWLTWYYKNCPSVIRGWRSSQLACLHIAKPSAKLYPEHFLNEAQLEKQRRGKLRFMPGPPSVIEAPLLVGFVGRAEQTGHPAQKPVEVFKPLVLMTTKEGDTVLDPMCGSGTTGVVCRILRRKAMLCDSSEEYIKITEKRLKFCSLETKLPFQTIFTLEELKYGQNNRD